MLCPSLLQQQQKDWLETEFYLPAVGNRPVALKDVYTVLVIVQFITTEAVFDILLPTHLWKDNMIFSTTLRTADYSPTISFLLLVEPTLQTFLVNPFSAAFTPAWAHPICTIVIFFSGKTHPTVSVNHKSLKFYFTDNKIHTSTSLD